MKRFILFALFLALLGAAYLTYDHFFIHKGNGNELVIYGNVDVRQVDIGFRVAGQIETLFFEEGDVVKKGSLMALLDKSPYDSSVRQAKSNAKALKASLDNAEILYKRRQELIGDGSVSEEDLNNSKSTYDQLLAQFNASKAALNISVDNLSFTKTYAPTDGIILTRVREPGTVVREADPVYTLSVSSPIWIRAFISEIHLGQIDYGMSATITTDNPNGHSYIGKVGFISPMAEFTPKTVETTELRTDLVYRLRIYVDEPDSGLRQGMPVTVTFDLNKSNKTKNE